MKFKGNSAFNNLKLKEQISLEPTSFFKEKILKKDASYYSKNIYEDDVQRLIRFYQHEGYLNVQFAPPSFEITKKNKVILTFNINEKAPIIVKSIDYLVDSTKQLSQALPRKELRNIRLQSNLREENIFKDEWCLQDQQLIINQFNDIGYAFANADFDISVDTTSNSADILWLVDKGTLTHFGKTTITGNNRVSEKNIRKQLIFEEGDVWSKSDIDLTQKRIFNLGMFRVSSLKTSPLKEERDTLPIQVILKEAPKYTTRFGVGYGREDKFRVFGEVQRLGFITDIGRLNVSAKHSALEPYNFDLKFTQPAILFPINSIIINPYIQKQNEPGYSVEKEGFNFTFLQNFSDNFNSNINFFFEDVTLDTTNISSYDPSQLPESVYLKSGISVGFSFFNGEPKLNPINGHSIAINIKTNGLYITRDMPFYRSLLEYKRYWGLNYGLTLAFKGKLGTAKATDGSDIVPAEERFYAGGAHSVRGWSRANLGPKNANGTPIGGKSLLEGSFEARVNITPKLIIATFIDAGNVWEPSFHYRLNDLGYASGLGIRYDTPIGPAGIDFARPIFNAEKRWQIHFNIGHPF
ncbi:BamA/OMP85 family outer membrane protein [Carboxylicivirga linearis]|uniref:BamA/TamA family outer membrane protein n=1 Tax=Carboxylicivirga linearis TaxID=1628157 RepID=A0ABS5JQZ8_9BACT|nr:BamA/TamA family outer membrane protein [Carboxylicivirga linearis]MBS2097235.1 BamA/TamA family outer membrane protein [Carboxylicivirga linearis]